MLRVIFLLALLFGNHAQASTLKLAYEGEYPLTSSIYYHFSTDTKLEFHELLAIEGDLIWTKNNHNDINFGFGDGVYWLKTNIINENALVKNWALEFKYAPLDQIEAYLVQDGELIQYHLGGDTVSFSNKSIKYPRTVFPIKLEPNIPINLYIRVESSGAIQVPMSIWEWEKFNTNTLQDFLLQGLFLGFVIIMALYNFMVWLKEREAIYLSYIAYISFTTLFQLGLSGIGFHFLWPEQAWLNTLAPSITLSLALASFNYFINDFFNMKTHSPIAGKMFIRLFYLFLMLPILSLFIPYYLSLVTMAIMSLINVLIVIGIAFYMLRIKHPSAQYFAIAWSGLLIGAILLALNKFGIIPVSYITEHMLQIGAGFEIMVLTLALAERMSISQKEALSLAVQVNEEREKTFTAELENLRIEKESKEELENIVEERTKKLSLALDHLSIAHDKLQTISITDALTELHNRYYFNEHFKIEYKRAFREQSECALIMLDIDFFKKVNDTYGHPAGDFCLKHIAKCIKENAARSSDIRCRYGGEEFIIILPSTSLIEAFDVAENIRESIKQSTVTWEKHEIQLTASFGVSSTIPKSSSTNSRQFLLNQADQALYQAKENGRDNVTMFGSDIV